MNFEVYRSQLICQSDETVIGHRLAELWKKQTLQDNLTWGGPYIYSEERKMQTGRVANLSLTEYRYSDPGKP